MTPKEINPSDFDDPAKIRGIMANAKRLDRPDLVLKCQLRIAELAGSAYDDEIEREFWRAVTCAEEFKTAENGKTTRLSRTRQKYERDGALGCISHWALNAKTTDGFHILVNAGRPEFTAEAIVIRHSTKFSDDVVSAAKKKLSDHGIDSKTVI